MKKEELRKRMPSIMEEMGMDGIREELAEHFETAGQSAAALAGLSDDAIQDLYISTFCDPDDAPTGWYEQWHRDYTGR